MAIKIWYPELEEQDNSQTPLGEPVRIVYAPNPYSPQWREGVSIPVMGDHMGKPCRKYRVHVEVVRDPERIAYFEANQEKFW